MKSGKVLKFLIDTGSNKNYVKSCYIRCPIQNEKPFTCNSVGGVVKITHHQFIDLFQSQNSKLKFFLLPTANLASFDGIIGNDSLKQLEAVIHTSKIFMNLKPNIKIPLKQHVSDSVNSVNIRSSHMTPNQEKLLRDIINGCPTLFADSNEKLTYTSRVEDEIRTSTDDPVYSKSYPYPMGLKKQIDEEINKLLEDNIIRPSRSPYNSPVWIVPKKKTPQVKKI